MERRKFLGKSGCGLAALMAAPISLDSNASGGQANRRRYQIEVEIYENKKNRQCHKVGEKFKYPDDMSMVFIQYARCPHTFTAGRHIILEI